VTKEESAGLLEKFEHLKKILKFKFLVGISKFQVFKFLNFNPKKSPPKTSQNYQRQVHSNKHEISIAPQTRKMGSQKIPTEDKSELSKTGPFQQT
jgi:hypothetical protein